MTHTCTHHLLESRRPLRHTALLAQRGAHALCDCGNFILYVLRRVFKLRIPHPRHCAAEHHGREVNDNLVQLLEDLLQRRGHLTQIEMVIAHLVPNKLVELHLGKGDNLVGKEGAMSKPALLRVTN